MIYTREKRTNLSEVAKKLFIEKENESLKREDKKGNKALNYFGG